MATSEAVVVHHGREGERCRCDDVRPTAATACWAARACDAKGGRPACSVFLGRPGTNGGHRTQWLPKILRGTGGKAIELARFEVDVCLGEPVVFREQPPKSNTKLDMPCSIGTGLKEEMTLE